MFFGFFFQSSFVTVRKKLMLPETSEQESSEIYWQNPSKIVTQEDHMIVFSFQTVTDRGAATQVNIYVFYA